MARLVVLITRPESCMTGCILWPRFSFLEAYVGGERVGRRMLPIGEAERKTWSLVLSIPVGLVDWHCLSLDLFVQRVDYDPRQMNNLELIRGGPHTSRYEAVIARARVKLLDALVVGDVDDEDEVREDRKKRRREEMEGTPPRLEGTLVFQNKVMLHDRVVTAPLATTNTEPRPMPVTVSCGTVEVVMAVFHD